jgi:hypothetical protein
MLALLGDRLPAGPDWSHEVKWDGYRALLIKHSASVQLRSRRDADLTASYPSLVAAGRSLRARDVILDGEIVALDANGHPSFQALQHRSTPGTFVIAYYAFDILSLNGHSLTDRPLRAPFDCWITAHPTPAMETGWRRRWERPKRPDKSEGKWLRGHATRFIWSSAGAAA